MATYPRNLNPFLDPEEDGDNASKSSATSFFSTASPPSYLPPPAPSQRVITKHQASAFLE